MNDAIEIAILKKKEKAVRYLNEPHRFTIQENQITLSSDHGIRTLMKKDDIWICDCEFFEKHNTCSHSMAVEQFIIQKY